MKILAVQSRMGIGDTVIFLPFMKALFKKFNSPISILVKENSKANQYLHQTKYIDKILTLERDNKTNNRHGGFFGIFKLANDLKKYKFDKIFIFNSSLRFNLVAKISGIPQIYQYPLFAKNKQHIIEAPKKFLKKNLDLDINEDPEVQIDSDCTRLDNFTISEILPLIKNCNVSICNDSSFSHLSSALGIKTITLMADTPLIYGNYSSKMFPIIPDGENTVTHNTLGKDKIDPQKIFERFLEIIA